MILSANQPCYLPSLRLFNRIAQSDVYMHCPHLEFDDAWHKRNYIKSGPLSVPCHAPKRADGSYPSIGEVTIINDRWRMKHLKTIKRDYQKEPFFHHYYPKLEQILMTDWRMLALMNQALIEQICEWLEIKTRIVDSANWHWDEGDAIDKNIQLCKVMGANIYLQGGGARKENGGYMGEEELKRMNDAGIAVIFQDYKSVVQELSAIGCLFGWGSLAREITLRGWRL